MTTHQFFLTFITFLVIFNAIAAVLFFAGVADYAAERKLLKGGKSLK